jgi:DNA-binding NtrC family response regulator
MALEFDFIGPNDKPALVLLSTPDWLDTAKATLYELGYKVHALTSHEEFASRFAQVQYQVVITELMFAASTPGENVSLLNLQRMQMNQRRHACIVMLGYEFETLNAMQAFQQSVHAVVNPLELPSLGQIIQQVVSDTNLMLGIYRDTQTRIIQGKL